MKYTKQQLENMSVEELTIVRNELTINSNNREEESTCPHQYETVTFPNSFKPSIYTRDKGGISISINSDGTLDNMCGFQFNLRGISFKREYNTTLTSLNDLIKSDVENSTYTIKFGLNGLVSGYNLSDENIEINSFEIPFINTMIVEIFA